MRSRVLSVHEPAIERDSLMDNFRRDLYYALRGLATSRRVALSIIAILALGIGTNISIFSVVDLILFHPLAVREPHELVRLFSSDRKNGSSYKGVSFPLYLQYRDHASVFSGLAAYSSVVDIQLTDNQEMTNAVKGVAVTGNFFQVAGASMMIGRPITTMDDEANSDNHTVLLSYRLWQRRFDGDQSVLGSTVRLNKEVFRVVGVVSPDFLGVDLNAIPDIWIPLSVVKNVEPVYRTQMDLPENPLLSSIGRLKGGMTVAGARSQLETLASDFGAGTSVTLDRGGHKYLWHQPWPQLDPAIEVAGTNWKTMGWLLSLVVLLILLVACSNVASLLLTRGDRRKKETAIRLALGAPRSRIIRIHLLEGALLAAFGSLLGLAVAYELTDILLKLKPSDLNIPIRSPSAILDGRILFFAAILGAVAAIAFSVAPAIRAVQEGMFASLKGQKRSLNKGNRRFDMRSVIVAGQVGILTFLSIITGLLLHTLWNGTHIDPGVNQARILVADMNLAKDGYSPSGSEALLAQLIDPVRALPGVRSIALAGQMQTGLERKDDKKLIMAYLPMVTSGYFSTLDIRMIHGRDFISTDRKGAPDVGIVNQTLARELWGDKDPIGQYLEGVGPADARVEIVGLVADSRMTDALQAPPPTLYVPLLQFYAAFPWQPVTTVYINCTDNPLVLRSASMRALSQQHLTPYNVESLEDRLHANLGEPRFLAALFFGFSFLVIVLGIMGLYGLIVYQIESRRKEISIRMALGAQRKDIVLQFLRIGLLLTSSGIVLGLGATFVFSRTLQSLLFNLKATDPSTLVLTICSVYVITIIACYLPARHIATMNPLANLRLE